MKLARLLLRERPDPEAQLADGRTDKLRAEQLYIAGPGVNLEADYTARVVRINGRVLPFEMVKYMDEVSTPPPLPPPPAAKPLPPAPPQQQNQGRRR